MPDVTCRKNRLTVDAEELIFAMQGHDPETEHFLDSSTGKIVFSIDEGVTGIEDELEQLIEEQPDRFLFIEPVSPSIGVQVMADFIEQLPFGKPRERMTRALQHGRPFRRFKDQLLEFPDIRQQWFDFEYEKWLDIAREWIEDEGLEADLKVRPNR